MVENMRKAMRVIESRAAYALQHQPDDEAECKDFFSEVLKGIHATSELAIKGIEVA